MIVSIRYGKDQTQKVDIPDNNYIGTFYPKNVTCANTADIAIENSINNPIGYQSLYKFLDGGKNIVFIVNDGTRPTPTSKVLDVLSKKIDLRSIKYLVATGNHRNMTEEEYHFVFGSHYCKIKNRITCHDSKRSECVKFGISRNGTPIEINKIAIDADRLVIITSIEPHYFAGYTGGRKSLLPGVASFRTIEANHRLAMNEEAKSLVLNGNPVHEDMMDALEVIGNKNIFSIQMVLDRHQNIYKVISGTLNPAFNEAVKWANDVFLVPIPEKADLVISVAMYPMDVDLYQSQKAIDNGKWGLKRGGKILLVSKCREGIGPSMFLKQLSISKDPNKTIKNLKNGYRLGYHKAIKVAEIETWASIWAVTDIDPGIMHNINITPFATVAKAVE